MFLDNPAAGLSIGSVKIHGITQRLGQIHTDYPQAGSTFELMDAYLSDVDVFYLNAFVNIHIFGQILSFVAYNSEIEF